MKKISLFSSRIISIRDFSEDVKLIRVSVPPNFNFKAGQYLSLSVFREDGAKIRRPLSIASPPGKNGYVEFCVKLIQNGLASEFVRKLEVGNEVELFGPVGKFTIGKSSKDKDLVFVAQGVGVAPFASIIPDLLKNGFGRKIILLKSSRSEEDSLYDSELSKLSSRYKNFEFHNVLSRPKKPKGKDVGYVQDFLKKYVPRDFRGNFYICGLNEMIWSAREKLLGMDFGEERIFYEKFD